jgi:ACS family tartrate transporter-like MFS transporter
VPPTQADALSPTTPAVDRARQKASRRLLPFLFLLYIVAYLDRANVAFARLPMAADLRFSEAVYGFGAGVFFIGYMLLEIPGALLVERWSARRWIARILVSWGICTALVGCIRTAPEFYVSRFLLGAAEAGFFPGIIVYLTHWFREQDRARAMAGFLVAGPAALALGGPLSALILQMDWLGVPAWRWLFIIQGAPAVILGFICLGYLTDWPRDARWLTPSERDAIDKELEYEAAARADAAPWWRGIWRPNVLLLCVAFWFANVAGYGFIFWLPSLLKEAIRSSAAPADALAALPFGLAMLATWLSGRSCDRTGERRAHTILPLLSAAVLFGLTAIPRQPPVLTMALLSLTGAAAFSWQPAFWLLPMFTSARSTRAASIGFINSSGNLGGFFGPAMTGFLFSQLHSNFTIVALVSVSYFASAALVMLSSVAAREAVAGTARRRNLAGSASR